MSKPHDVATDTLAPGTGPLTSDVATATPSASEPSASEPPVSTPSASAPGLPSGRKHAVVYDLGYQRYRGRRLQASARWRPIMRNQIATAWKTWWRLKMPVAHAGVIAIVAAVVMYVSSNKVFATLISRGIGVTFADGILPFSMRFYCQAGFVFSLTVAASAIASDIQHGGFTFYFARPVRPIDYLFGKFMGLFACTAMIFVGGPLILAIERIALSDDVASAARLAPLLGKTLLAGIAGAALYAALPLGMSALAGTKRNAIALWAALYVLGGSTLAGLGMATHLPLGALDPPTALVSFTFELFDVQMRGRSAQVSLAWAALGMSASSLLALGVAYRKIAQARGAGIGGAP